MRWGVPAATFSPCVTNLEPVGTVFPPGLCLRNPRKDWQRIPGARTHSWAHHGSVVPGQLPAWLWPLAVPFFGTKASWGPSSYRGKRIQVAGKVPWVGHCYPEFKPISLLLYFFKDDFPQLNRLFKNQIFKKQNNRVRFLWHSAVEVLCPSHITGNANQLHPSYNANCEKTKTVQNLKNT